MLRVRTRRRAPVLLDIDITPNSSSAALLRAARTLSYLVRPTLHAFGLNVTKPNRSRKMPAENPAKGKEITKGIATSPKVKDMSHGDSAGAGVLSWMRPVGLQSQTRVAILIPAYNEELTIGEVVSQFRAQLPEAALYVFDNNSADQTVALAKAAGATVFHERRQGQRLRDAVHVSPGRCRRLRYR